MRLFRIWLCLLCLFLCGSVHIALAQVEPELTFSATTFSLGEEFSITLSVSKEKVKQVSNFPEITDFIKGNTLFSKDKKIYIIKQFYRPRKVGAYSLEDFTMTVNHQVYRFSGTQLKVVASTGKKMVDTHPKIDTDEKYQTIKEDYFLHVNVGKQRLYKGESTLLTAHLLIPVDHQAELTFVDVKEQLSKLVNAIKPDKCWTEDISSLHELTVDSIHHNGKMYSAFVLYKGYISSIDSASFVIPSVSFKMLRYKVAKSSTEIKRKEEYFTLQSSPIPIHIQPLPNRKAETLNVGNYYTTQKISHTRVALGRGFTYVFSIHQQGVGSTIQAPIATNNKNFNIFTPRIQQTWTKVNGKHIATKSFEYTIVPQVAGRHSLSNLLSWAYYNVAKGKIDTLRPDVQVEVKKRKQNNIVKEEEEDEFLQLINKSSNSLLSLENDPRLKWASNILIILMLLVTVVIILKK